LFAAFGDAPKAKRDATTFVWPALDALCRGVQRSWVCVMLFRVYGGGET
jgi:hypothetical protein